MVHKRSINHSVGSSNEILHPPPSPKKKLSINIARDKRNGEKETLKETEKKGNGNKDFLLKAEYDADFFILNIRNNVH